ncbi:histidine kinase [Paenibacillus montaniterrae]|uniref:Histidine kinase n=1 Tax=Paenibacillus montaniterrae TaxID=429341 RepID=A0A919YKS9_9BACL|nr:sensor histidine kinase [Paenibacillus montaniterrae]GIP15087.1 histidine kinase [Paenibacillus montaniterrae]
MRLKRIAEKLKYHNLFIKMFSITLVSIITVAVLTWFVMIRISEQVFMDTFSITNGKIMTQIQTSAEAMNYAVSMTASNANISGEIKRFLTRGQFTTIEALSSHYKVTQEMKRLQSTLASYPIAMVVIGNNGNRHATDTTFWPPTYKGLNEHFITEQTIQSPRKLHYHIDMSTLDGQQNEQAVIVASKAMYEQLSGEIYGVLYFAIKEAEFKKNYSGFTSEGNDVLLLNRSGIVVSSNVTSKLGTTEQELLDYAKQIEQQGEKYINVDWQGKQYLILSTYLPTYDLYLVNTIDKRVALSQMLDVKTLTLIIAAIVFISLIIVFIVSRRITRSLTLLARQMSRVTKRNFGNYIVVSGSNEIKEVGKAYNLMLDELNEYIAELLKSQKEQRNAELSALQMQINPHFLYNTLASVKILVQQGNKDKATATINALIELLQNTIGNASEMITVKQELVNLKNYVFINHVRYGEQIKVNYFIDEQCYDFAIPKLIIQPFIENAFFHAFRGQADGYIYVMISREGSNLVCEIVDDGVGFDMDWNESMPASKNSSHFFSGIGIRNVNDRLELLYGEGYGVQIHSSKGEGTRIKLLIPVSVSKEITKT